MRRGITPTVRLAAMAIVIGSLLGLGNRLVFAGEEDDLQRQIDTQRAGLSDLDRLDDLRATTDEIALLKNWLDEAWNLRSKHEYDEVREVLDRCIAQAELVRQKINAARLRAQVQKREATLNELHDKIQKTKKALFDMTIKKKALEGTVQ
ncbi:MAG TPA: hypothetical protein VGL59_13865 [Polyangia bacterium]|jgi:hypothetical protein